MATMVRVEPLTIAKDGNVDRFITYVSVQYELSERHQRIILLRPDFCHVKNVPPVGLGIDRIHDLKISCPRGILLPFDGFKEILDVMVRILTSQFFSFFPGESLDSLITFEVNFHVFERSVLGNCQRILPCQNSLRTQRCIGWEYLLGEFVCVSAISVNVTKGSRGPAITEELDELVDAFLVVVVETDGQ